MAAGYTTGAVEAIIADDPGDHAPAINFMWLQM
jgi:hypothetical protein